MFRTDVPHFSPARVVAARGILMSAGLCVILIFQLVALPHRAMAEGNVVERAVLDGGMTVLNQPADGGLTAVCVFAGGGSASEEEALRGITRLLDAVISSTVTGGGGESLKQAVERAGGVLDVRTRQDFSCFTLVAPPDCIGPALKLIGSALSAPVLTDDTLLEGVRLLRAADEIKDDRPVDVAYSRFLGYTYPESPYGHDPESGPSAGAGITAGGLARWHQARFYTGNMLVSVCGDMTLEGASEMVVDAFGGMRTSAGSASSGTKAVARPITVTSSHNVAGPDGRAVAVLGYDAPPVGSPDYPAVKLAEAAAASGMGSMLFRALRVDRATAYSFGSFLTPCKGGSRLVFYVSTGPDNIDAAVDAIISTVEGIKSGGLPGAGLDRAIAAAQGESSTLCEDGEGRAWTAGVYELAGAGAGYRQTLDAGVAMLGAKDMADAARKYFDKYTLVVMRPGTAKR